MKRENIRKGQQICDKLDVLYNREKQLGVNDQPILVTVGSGYRIDCITPEVLEVVRVLAATAVSAEIKKLTAELESL